MKKLTKIVTAALLLALFVTSLSACALLNKPAGDDPSNPDYFLYENNDDGSLTVIGLTEKGKARTTLTIPATANGKSVTVLGNGEAVFAGASSLESVTVNDTVAYISAGAFDNCPSLKTVVLNTDPTKTSTHETDLLLGVSDSLRFSAKSTYLTSFATDYYWSPYTARFDFTE